MIFNHKPMMALAVGALGSVAEARTANAFTSFWALGDSLSDPGNLYSLKQSEPPKSDPPKASGMMIPAQPIWAISL